MARIIETPQDIFPEITEDFQKMFGSSLISIILYGSGAGSHYIGGKSDLNFLIILRDTGINYLERGIPIIEKWRKKKATFIFMTANYIKTSVDCYPVEFLNMKLLNFVVYGENLLRDLNIEHRYLRLQLEREFKGKLFHLQQGFLETKAKEKRLLELIGVSLGAFIPLFKALLFLKGHEIPHARRDVVKALALAFPVKEDILLKCIDVRDGIGKYASGEIRKVFQSYHEEIARLSEMIDVMKV